MNDAAAGTTGSTTRLRIALAYDARYPERNGGAERRYHEIATRLSARHDLEYVTWGTTGGTNVTAPAYRIRDLGPAPPLYGPDGKRTVREAVSYAARLLPALVRGRYDVIDCAANPYVPLYACWFASRITRTPLVVTWHEFWGDHWLSYLPDRPLVARAARSTEGAARRVGDLVVPVSSYTARRMGLSADGDPRVRVVGNGVSLDSVAGARARRTTDVIFVGRLIDEKRVDLLVEAIAQLRHRLPQITCTIVGDGPERQRLEALVTTLDLTTHVQFLGAVDGQHVSARLMAARVLALPSVREGFGIAVLEAQAAGAVPVVVRGSASAAPELVEHGVDGLVCDPTAESLATTINELLADPARREVMAANAQRSARQSSWDAVADRMESIYFEAVRLADAPRHAGRPSPSCP